MIPFRLPLNSCQFYLFFQHTVFRTVWNCFVGILVKKHRLKTKACWLACQMHSVDGEKTTSLLLLAPPKNSSFFLNNWWSQTIFKQFLDTSGCSCSWCDGQMYLWSLMWCLCSIYGRVILTFYSCPTGSSNSVHLEPNPLSRSSLASCSAHLTWISPSNSLEVHTDVQLLHWFLLWSKVSFPFLQEFKEKNNSKAPWGICFLC